MVAWFVSIAALCMAVALLIIGFFVRLVYIPAVIVLGFWAVVQFFSGFMTLGVATGGAPGGGVAFWAHVGGFAFGALVAWLFYRRRGGPGPTEYGVEQGPLGR